LHKKHQMTDKVTPRIGVLLVNLGTPDSTKTGDVRKYLREFLMDGRVLDVPYVLRFLLVNLIIAPFRASKSAKLYRKVWLSEGSPLLVYSQRATALLQETLGEEFKVVLGMRYQSPSIEKALLELKGKGLDKIIVVPLFPQYASASTGSAQEKVMELVSKWQIVPEIAFIQSFFDHPKFIEAFAAIGKRHLETQPYDHVIFSYHGLPERHIRKGDHTGTCLQAAKLNPAIEGEPNCCATMHADNRGCYRAQCFATTRLLADALGLVAKDYTVSFQSRLLNDPWLKPYTDLIIKDLVGKGKKRILTFSPSFIADCLETIEEIGEEYKEVFEDAGGEHWQMAESLNDSPIWIETLKSLVLHYAPILPR